MTQPAVSLRRVRIWDLPTRLFHWLLMSCVIGAYVCIKLGGLWVDWHFRFGYAVLTLIVFRLIWGVVGPERARFWSFVRGPGRVWAYLRGQLPDQGGHNPLGALSVVAMLLAIGFQTVSGLFANDDIINEGPLAGRVVKDMSDQLTGLHDLNEWVLIGLIALHVLAVLYYTLFKKKRLVGPMITGDDRRDANDIRLDTTDDWAMRLRGLVVALVSCGLVWAVVTWGRAAGSSFGY